MKQKRKVDALKGKEQTQLNFYKVLVRKNNTKY